MPLPQAEPGMPLSNPFRRGLHKINTLTSLQVSTGATAVSACTGEGSLQGALKVLGRFGTVLLLSPQC